MSKKQIYDISVPLSESLPFWPKSAGFKSKRVLNMNSGDVCNSTEITMCVHAGTHIDAPWHFVQDGKPTKAIPLNTLIGECHVVEIKHTNRITAKHLEEANIPQGIERLLLHTDNSVLWGQNKGFYEDFCALNECAAEWIVKHNIKVIGIDYLSIQKYGDGPEVHHILLQNEVVIIEGLNLTDIKIGKYELICLPLSVEKTDGIGARAILRTCSRSF